MGTIRTVELFAGVGGFRLGLESASDRFKVIWANQWEPSMREQYAFECYTTHFGNKKYSWGKNDCHQRKVDRERQRTAENDRPDEKVTREGGEK